MRHRGQAVIDKATDADLAGRASGGDAAAFEELYRRHVEAAWRVALAVTTNPHDAADAVSDAFTRVFQALPERLHAADYFLPYLLAAVRNAAIDMLRRGGRHGVSETGEQPDGPTSGAEPAEVAMAGVDSALVASAFRSLPERWRSVLWLTEVEGIPAREVAGLMGVSPNGVAQLAVRARAGLRQRYLQAHLRQAHVRSTCRDTVARLGAYAVGALPPRDISKVDQHLAGCPPCEARLAQLEEMAPSLRRAVLPLPAGLAALTLGKWRLASSGAASATAAGAAAPAGIGLGAAAVAVPAPFITSMASVALFVAGVVGVGVVVQHQGGPSSAPAAAVVAQGPDASFRGAADASGARAGGTARADDPVGGLIAETARAFGDLAALTNAVTGSLPADVPAVVAPDQEDLEAATRGDIHLDVGPAAVNVNLVDGMDACPELRVLGAAVGCRSATPVVESTTEGAVDAAKGTVPAAPPVPSTPDPSTPDTVKVAPAATALK